jgi:hypothetical protein
MIYRIEANNDGSIASCIEVESSFKNGRLVFYIEANNKTEAVSKAKKKLESLKRLNITRRTKLKNQGLCQTCGVNPTDKIRCKKCNDLNSSHKKLRNTFKKNNDLNNLIKMDENLRIKRAKCLKEASMKGVISIKEKANKNWDTGKPFKNKHIRIIAIQILRIYDQDPINFREKITSFISQHERQTQAAE